MCESYVQPYSKPWPSATLKSSTIRWYGGSGRTVTPKLSMEPPRLRGRGRAYRRVVAANEGLRRYVTTETPRDDADRRRADEHHRTCGRDDHRQRDGARVRVG